MNFELHSAEDVARAIGIEVDTLYRYARSGKIHGMKVGKAWRFSEVDVQEFLQQQRHSSTSSRIEPTLLQDILRRAATESTDHSGLSCRGLEMSFAEVDAAADQLADSLLASGVIPGDRVLLLLPNCFEFTIACFAIWKAGCILVPEDPAIKDENLLHILADSEPQAMIVDHAVAERLDVERHQLRKMRVLYVKDSAFSLSGQEGVRVESLDAILENKRPVNTVRFNGSSPDDVASITYTSGTTGRPKGVMNTHRSWLAGACFTRDFHGLTKRDAIVIPLPPHHGLAFRQMLAYVLAGARMILATDIYQALKLMREARPSAAVLVPAGVNILLEHFTPLLRELAPSLRYIEIGSAPLAPARYEQLRALLPHTLIHLPYGLTEARVGFLKAGADGALNRIARVAPNLELRVVDEQRRETPAGVPGQILLRGPGLMKGYWGQTEEQIRSLQGDGFMTGDLAVIDERGDIALLGRVDEMLKVGGHKVNPSEIEAVLKRHPGVADCAVVGLDDPAGVFETKLHAFIVPRAAGSPPSELELMAECRARLEPFKLPSIFHFQTSLPKSAVGKILRRALRDAAQENGAGNNGLKLGDPVQRAA